MRVAEARVAHSVELRRRTLRTHEAEPLLVELAEIGRVPDDRDRSIKILGKASAIVELCRDKRTAVTTPR